MALEIKVELQNTKDTMVLADTTGDYNAVSNTTGWGSPNNVRADVATATVTVTDPSGTELANPEDVLTLFDPGTAFDLTTYIETEGALADGVWKFEFALTGVTDTAVTAYGLRDIEVKGRLAKLAIGDLDSNDFADFERRYRIALLAFEQGEYVTAQDIISDLNKELESCADGTNFFGLDCGC